MYMFMHIVHGGKQDAVSKHGRYMYMYMYIYEQCYLSWPFWAARWRGVCLSLLVVRIIDFTLSATHRLDIGPLSSPSSSLPRCVCMVMCLHIHTCSDTCRDTHARVHVHVHYILDECFNIVGERERPNLSCWACSLQTRT